MFNENPGLFHMNRDLSKKTKIKPAKISNGDQGVVIYYGNNIMVLTREEAVRLATGLVDNIDN